MFFDLSFFSIFCFVCLLVFIMCLCLVIILIIKSRKKNKKKSVSINTNIEHIISVILMIFSALSFLGMCLSGIPIFNMSNKDFYKQVVMNSNSDDEEMQTAPENDIFDNLDDNMDSPDGKPFVLYIDADESENIIKIDEIISQKVLELYKKAPNNISLKNGDEAVFQSVIISKSALNSCDDSVYILYGTGSLAIKKEQNIVGYQIIYVYAEYRKE